MDLTSPPPPLTQRQRTVVIVLTIVCAATRFLAMARSIWDWDEALFTLGMRAYDVTKHHPHPPGFPLFIALARGLRVFLPGDVRALQAVSLAAGVALFPAMVFLGRELRLRVEIALVAALLCAFFPNVWFFGGTAFSDVPSIVLAVVAVACLLRGCRSAEAYLTGSLVLALAIGMRPQNFLIGLVPGLIATWYRARRSWRDVVFAALIGAVVAGVAFGGAIAASGSFAKYMSTVRAHGEYIARVDSFRSPERPPLWRLFPRFFFQQYGAPVLSVILSALVVVSAVGAVRNRDRSILINVLAFGPMAVLAWLMLDRYSISRFSIGYIPMFAFLAADGIDRVVGWASKRQRGSRWRAAVTALAGAALALSFFLWMLPSLAEVRADVAPTVAAVTGIARHLDPKRDRLFVAFNMAPFLEVAAPDLKFTRLYDERGLPLSGELDGRRPWLLSEIYFTRPRGFVAHRERGHLWNVARRHYFDVSLQPIAATPQFTEGWTSPELTGVDPPSRTGMDEYRWCGRRGVIGLQGVTGEAVLRLEFSVPHELVPERPQVTILLNGRSVETIPITEETTVREWHLTPADTGAPNTLELRIDKVYNSVSRHTGEDPRDLGIRLHFLSFGAA